MLVIGLAYLIQGPPFVPSSDESANQMLALMKKYKIKRVLDMGSGNGKLVILLTKEGYQATGVELNPWLVFKSRRALRKAGLKDKASIRWGNFWSFKIDNYDAVTLYLVPHILPRLEKKLKKELKPGSYIVSNYFTMPSIKPLQKTTKASIYKV